MQPCSSETAHDIDYCGPRPMARKRRRVILPPKGMCFLCHREPAIDGLECLKCCIKADLSWVEGQIKFGSAA